MATDDNILADPLQYDVPLPLSALLYPMGFPVQLETNSTEILQAAQELWGAFECLRKTPPVTLRLALTDSKTAPSRQAPVFRGQGHLVACTLGAEDYAIADLARGYIFGWLTSATVSDRSWFRYHVLEPMVYVVMHSLHCTPVHAAAIALHGWGLLLCGDSGAGKTCLAYACAKRGWTYLTDDAVGIDRHSHQLVAIGRPHHVRFRSSASALFPELAKFPTAVRPNGKPDIEVDSSGLPISIASEANIAALVFLKRSGSASAGVEPFPTSAAFSQLEQVICLGEAAVRRAQRDHLRRLVELPTFQLQYSTFDEAEDHLRSVLESCI